MCIKKKNRDLGKILFILKVYLFFVYNIIYSGKYTSFDQILI